MNIFGVILLFILIGGSALIFQEQFRVFESTARSFVGGDFRPFPTNIEIGDVIDEDRLSAKVTSDGRTVGGSGGSRTSRTTSRPGLSSGLNGGVVRRGGEVVVGDTRTAVSHTIDSSVPSFKVDGYVSSSERRFQASPYAGQIEFLDVTRNIGKSNANDEYVIIAVADGVREPINISGWSITDFSSRTLHEIGDGVELFGDVNRGGDIILQGRDYAFITSGRSPVGFSFRVNKCSGFRTQYKTFTPSLKTTCVNPEDEFLKDKSIPFTDSACFEVVESLPRCEAVVRIPSSVSRACATFLRETLTESGCVKNHQNDADFFTSEWRIFLGRNRSLWSKENNAIYLLDANDRLVASLVY